MNITKLETVKLEGSRPQVKMALPKFLNRLQTNSLDCIFMCKVHAACLSCGLNRIAPTSTLLKSFVLMEGVFCK